MELTLDQALHKAVEAHKDGKVQEAERLYTAILKTQRKHPDANHNMGILAVGVGKVEEALPFFKAALEVNPSKGQFWLSCIDALIKLDRITDATSVFNQAKGKGAKGELFDQLEASLNLNSATGASPQAVQLIKKAIGYRESGEFATAIKILTNHLVEFSGSAELLSLLAHCYMLNDDAENASVYLIKANGVNPDNASVCWNNVRMLIKNKNVADALVVARKTIERYPLDIEGMSVLGSCLRLSKEFGESLLYLNKAISLNPDYAEALINRGLIKFTQKDKPGALSDLETAHKLKPHMKNIWDLLIGLNIELKQFESAISFLGPMIKSNPSNEKYFANLGICYQYLGNFESAIENYQRALEIKPDYAEAYNNMGAALSNTGDQKAAIDSYQQALKIKADYAEAYCNMGKALQKKGEIEAAIDSYQQALKIKADYAEAYYNMGKALQKKGEIEAAIDSFKKALKIKPDYADVYNNLGNALKGKGDLEGAIDSFKKALKIKPDYSDIYNNMGIALKDKGDLDGAIDSFKKALKIKPDYADVYNNMGIALHKKGDVEAAIDSYQQALKINPDYVNAYYNMGAALTEAVFNKPNSGLMEIILLLLDQRTTCRPNNIARAAISLLKLEPSLKELLEKHSLGTLRQSLQQTISTLAKLPLLLKLMSVCPIADLELESILVDIRSALLSSIDEISISPNILHFQSALALQCFTNEYIYNQTDKETELLEVLKSAIEKALSNGQQPSPQSVLCLASYAALHEYKWCELLAIKTDIEEVFIRQVQESKEENRLKANIPILQEITDKVSSKVREQYEESPYPRWVNLGLNLNPVSLSKVTSELKLSDNVINDVEAPNILIAGCGTGQHSITTASRFKDCNVLAVDLSLSSLAYAKRKTQELGLQNIDYMQADILDLGNLDKKFDIIESAGVLHHMEDPMAGWKVLADCLKSGGLMGIGLYSQLARQHIAKMREEIDQSDMRSGNDAMKLFRSALIKSDKGYYEGIQTSSDFYSLSALRDLLFHVQEYRFTIPQIKECLSDLGLKFCGFESDKIVKNFRLTNIGTDDPYDLDKWNAYENANPHAFAGMYQFWCQKVT